MATYAPAGGAVQRVEGDHVLVGHEHDLALTGPESDRRAGPRDVDRQRRAPASPADDRDAHAERRWPSFGSWPARSRAMFA